ncbi:MAG: WD40 repeat domain-containing protein [Eubacteriales bacterium]
MKNGIAVLVLTLCFVGMLGCANGNSVANLKAEYIYGVSHDGKWVTYLSNSSLHLRNTFSGKDSIIVSNVNLSSRGVVPEPWSTKATKLAFASPTGRWTHQLYVFDLNTNKLIKGPIVRDFMWLGEDNTFIARVSSNYFLGNALQPERLVPIFNDSVHQLLSFSPNSTYFVVSIIDGEKYLYAITDRSGNVIEKITGRVSAVVWSKDGRFLAYATNYPSRQLRMFDLMAKNDRLIKDSREPISKILFSPNGQRLAFVEKKNLCFVLTNAEGKETKLTSLDNESNVESGVLDESVNWLDDDHLEYVYYRRDFLTSHSYLVKTDLRGNSNKHSLSDQVPQKMWWIDRGKLFFYVEREDKMDLLREQAIN